MYKFIVFWVAVSFVSVSSHYHDNTNAYGIKQEITTDDATYRVERRTEFKYQLFPSSDTLISFIKDMPLKENLMGYCKDLRICELKDMGLFEMPIGTESYKTLIKFP